MKSSLLKTTVMLAIILSPVADATCQGASLSLSNYQGYIGDSYRAEMTLSSAGSSSVNKIEGSYFYVSSLKDIKLTGKIIDGTDIELHELSAKGKIVAHFKGHFSEYDPDPEGRLPGQSFRPHFSGKLECEVIMGIWQKVNSPKKLPFIFALADSAEGTPEHRYAVAGVSNDAIINRNAYRFWEAVKRKDRKMVASLINYPITVKLPSGRRRLLGARDLIANYDVVFSVEYRRAILNAVPHNMFANSQGVMLGDGVAWFGENGKIIALNISTPAA